MYLYKSTHNNTHHARCQVGDMQLSAFIGAQLTVHLNRMPPAAAAARR